VQQPGSTQNDSANGSHLHNAVDFKASAKGSNHGYVNLPMTFNGAYKDFIRGWRTVFFFVNFGLEIEIDNQSSNQQVWGKNCVSKVVINKYLSNESCKKRKKN
jgi:hypothetical protein